MGSEAAVEELPAALTLRATAGPCEGTNYSKAGPLLTVGRTRASKLHIKDSAVSEKHAELRWEGGHWNLTDVGSSNGTAVNGKKLAEGIALRLKDGDIILFGSDSLLTVELIPAFREHTTVEQHLRSECELLMQRVRGRAEQHANELLESWRKTKQELLAT
ncbi:SMAD/FHA domain-containing protein [Coccomyxa subellipsoidea C-169]|uniref:SMAD/FHA domain-containing protein n=1 Tax=Coccomyxa subellipsoidea (strain C-169) TaxID=574566 RepID=I0YNI5_COCSC|nr:SMAD/FHA domain-containing protein [Coccomyxa subellipsoidea C-169]EIE19954.1 SMAD/FHA domain-containing protein [Coccomyxa subellipsoidea C-169]|eukprot:XP_005644498.1 SMAD/FHA domain-containing protein [Coccomyxa subellipsoidea C-169]